MTLPSTPPSREWRQALWQRPVDPAAVADAIRQWATDQRSPVLVLETRLTKDGAVYLIGYSGFARDQVLTPLGALPNLSLAKPVGEREPVITSGHLTASTRHRPLRFDDPERLVRAILATLTRLKRGEQLVLQMVLGPRRTPLAVPERSPSSVVAPWYSVAWLGDGGQLDGEKRKQLRIKVNDFGFASTLRLGVTADGPNRRRELLLSLFAAVRVAEGPGLQLQFRRERPHHLNVADAPWHWPLRLGVGELVGLTAYPLGDKPLPGQPALHPKQLPPAAGTTKGDRVVADSTLVGSDKSICLPIESAIHHTHVIGPTGTGKSTLLASLILADIAAGRNVVVIEPKGDLVADVLSRLPEDRADDVVELDPLSSAPIGLNPLARHGRRPDLVADNMLSLFKQLYGSAIGPRSQDILYASLLTLAQRDDASLVMLPLLLTNPGLRRSLTRGLRDPLVLEPFWASFESWSDAERANATAPVMNKVRSLNRPGLRGVLGQRHPRFALSEVFTGSKLLFVPLQRGVIGADSARLLGSVVVSEIWNAIQARAAVPTADRRPVVVYIDEVQDYVATGTDLGEALAQARGYGVGFTLAHQFLGQLSSDLRNAVLTNARSRIVFQLPHADALAMEKGHPELTAADFEALPRFQVYASIFANGQVTPYASGRTRALPPATTDPSDLRRRSRERYGRRLDEVEAGFAGLLDDIDDRGPGPVGRRRRPT